MMVTIAPSKTPGALQTTFIAAPQHPRRTIGINWNPSKRLRSGTINEKVPDGRSLLVIYSYPLISEIRWQDDVGNVEDAQERGHSIGGAGDYWTILDFCHERFERIRATMWLLANSWGYRCLGLQKGYVRFRPIAIKEWLTLSSNIANWHEGTHHVIPRYS